MSEQEESKDNLETLERIIAHLDANSINSNSLDPNLVVSIVSYLAETENVDPFELNKTFLERGIISKTEHDTYLSASYIMAIAIMAPKPENFLAVAPVETMLYNIKCEMKAALTKDISYTIHGKRILPLSMLKSCFKSNELRRKYDYDSVLKSVKLELGLIKPKENKKKEQRKNQPKAPKPKKDVNLSKPEKPLWLGSEYEPLFQTQTQKINSVEPGKKRRQKLTPAFDMQKVETKVKQKITAGENIESIIGYITDQTGTGCENAKLFFDEMIYESVKNAVWADKSVSKNTISYLSKNKQVKIADEYISRNTVSETIGIQRISSSKKKLLKHLALEEDTIDEIISAKLQKYAETSERIDAAYPAQAPLEERIGFEEKPVFVTKHVKQRALQRIGEGANKSEFLTDMFYSGRTIHVQYDVNPHRIFEFSGEEFEVPYVDTGEDYVLLTVFPIKNY